jgi:hypothetical protein
MADEQPQEQPDFGKAFAGIVKREKPKTHHECECRECNPLTAMGERGDAFAMALALLSNGKWHDDDVPSVREAMFLADWLLYGPGETQGD